MLNKLRNGYLKTIGSERGQGLVEYALILVLIAIVVMAGVKGLGNTTSSVFNNINGSLK